jgi:hypothetical protein
MSYKLGKPRVDLAPLCCSVNDIPTPSHHTELAQHINSTALIAMSHSPSLLVSYLEAYLNRLELWLWNWKIVINVSKSTTILFVKAIRHI